MTPLKYRPDIDGLRAIAVLAVMGYHAFPSHLTGGFVGVDMFFVISGFLISTIILGDLEKNNFSYIAFYSRRIKRIFPALILVLTATWLFGWFVLFPDEFKQLGKHMAGGLGFISNLILWGEAGYFDNLSETKPLLHLWSLGIEEQFYILWPVVLGFVWKKKLNFLAVILIIALTSFVSNLIATPSISAFYLPTNRFWELMIGGGLAYIVLYKEHLLLKNKTHANIQSALGVTLIILSVDGLNKYMPFPGWRALQPTFGAFLLLSSKESFFNQSILGNRILVAIGLISYPLYLWHWSLLSFAHILDYRGGEIKLVLIGVSFLLAWLTYKFIENKVRKSRGRYWVYMMISSSLLLIGIGLGTWRGVFSPRNNTQGVKLAAEAAGDWDYPNGLKIENVTGLAMYVKHGAKKKVLFYGDSHVEQYAPRIVKLITEHPTSTKTAVFATIGGCPPIPNVYEDQHPGCNKRFKEQVLRSALSPEIDSVVIGASWGYLIQHTETKIGGYRYYYLKNETRKYFDADGIPFALKALEAFILSISKHKKVFLIIGNPTGASFDPKSFFSGTRITGIVDKRVYFQEYDKQQKALGEKLREIAKRANAVIIDPIKHFCKDKQCRTVLSDGTPIYKDAGHIRPFYIRQFADFMDVTVKK